MSCKSNLVSSQSVLPFFCEGCYYKKRGRCKGATNLKIYEMTGKSFVGCATENKTEFLYDIFKEYIPVGSSNQSKLVLPPYIPQFFSRKRESILPLENRLVAISLTTFLNITTGKIKFKNKSDLIRALGLPANTRIALVGTCNDFILEKFWTISDTENFWQIIADFGFEFVTGLTLSVLDELPLFSHKFNQDRNFLSHDKFAHLGVPCIPFLMPFDEKDYEYIGVWLKDRNDVNIVAIHGSSYSRSPKLFNELINRMRKIESLSPRHLKFLVVGIAKPNQMKILLNKFDSTIVNPRPFMEVIRAGNGYDANLHIKSDKRTPKDELLFESIVNFENFCSSEMALSD
ncbi:MAG: hypothetical protein M3367_02165 [Acidobacteriota bacterium]|nr:hypothetical protein [Acidobacteriota bacterium]